MSNILKAVQRELLIAAWKANSYSTNARSSKKVINRNISPTIKSNQKLMKKINKTYDFLLAKGYLVRNPSGRSTTYKVTKIGQEYLSSIGL